MALPNVRSRTGRSFGIDTHFLDDETSEAAELRALNDTGWINLLTTDTTWLELSGAQDDKRDDLLDLAAAYVARRGPMVLDHSVTDLSLAGTDEDDDRLAAVFAILRPGLGVITPTTNPRHVRDAIHVATAIRYGADGFITKERKMLNKNDAIRDAFGGFTIFSPATALAFIRRLIARSSVSQADPES